MKRIIRRAAITGGLEAARVLGALKLMQAARGHGAIFTLHHVRPKVPRPFEPNAHLEITPQFLEAAILRLKRDGYRFLPLSDVATHLASGTRAPVAVFTLDDGYRNNLDHAAPVFARHGVPFTVFATRGFIERTHTLWWETLADLLQAKPRLTFDFGDGPERLHLGTVKAMDAAFARFTDFVHGADERAAVQAIDTLARTEGIDPVAITQALTLDPVGIARLAASPMASIGAHSISHRALARLGEDEARAEIETSIATVADLTGRTPTTFAYPYGDKRAVSDRDIRIAAGLGLTAVTTQPGTLDAACALSGPNLAALPRISLNGHFQKPAYVGALASGIPFRLMGGG